MTTSENSENQWTKENTWAVGKIPSGLFIVTSGDKEKDQWDGYLGSWIQQVSFSPLKVMIAIKPGRPCYDHIKAHGQFAINVVGQNNNGAMKPFWSGYNPEVNPFEKLGTQISEGGNILLRDCMASIECKVTDSVKPGDHEILFADVMLCHQFKADDKPLTHVRKSGLDY